MKSEEAEEVQAAVEGAVQDAAQDAEVQAEEAPLGSVMRNHDFVKLWAGESVSLIGTQITQFTLPLIAVLTLKASVFQVGLLNASRTAPVVVISLFAGVWLDRYRRRPILIGCSLGSALLIGLIPLSSQLHMLSMNLLYAVCLSAGVLSVVFDVGVVSYVPSLVDKRHLASTNSRIQTSTSLAMVAGPGIAGALVGVLTAPVTLTLDAASYLCSAAGLISIKRREPAIEAAGKHPSVFKSIGEGLRGVFGTGYLRDLLCQAGTFNLFQQGLITVLVVYALKVLHLTPFELGVVLGAIAVGGILGASLANRIRERIGFGRTLVVGVCLGSLCPMLLLIPSSNSIASILFMMVVEFAYGFGVLMFGVNTITFRQVITPSRLLGRMNASFRLVVLGTQPIGASLGGLLGDKIGLRPALDVIVGLITLPLLWAILSPLYRLKEMPTEPLPELQLLDAASTPERDTEVEH